MTFNGFGSSVPAPSANDTMHEFDITRNMVAETASEAVSRRRVKTLYG